MKYVLPTLLLAVIFFSCQKELNFDNSSNTSPAGLVPTLTTTVVTSITNSTALSGGNITNAGASPVTARGVCWSTGTTPTIAGSHTSDGTGTGVFVSSVAGLTANTVYHVRAYATNTAGTAYGNEISFTTTTSTTALPTVITAPIGSVTTLTASGGGTVTADGGAPVTVRGICWSTSANPVATGNHTTDGSGIGTFAGYITGLTAGTTYHVRAYATNSVGTAYGGDSLFTTSSAPSATDVYVAGYQFNASLIPVATLWKNGVPTSLTSGTNTGIAYSVYVSGTDEYVAGNDYGDAVIWKNGIATYLTTGASGADAYSVFVSGIDVYAAGVAGNQAILWKNGVAFPLTSAAANAAAKSVFVSGSDVYVAGYEGNGGPSKARLWKNGAAVSLASNGNTSEAESVFISGTDVYVAGHEDNGLNSVAKLWKNGAAAALTDGTNYAYASAVVVAASNVYVSGYELNGAKYVAKVWKNGTATSLTGGTSEAYAESVFLSGSDVYVTGSELTATNIGVAKIWRNGVLVSVLTNGNTNAGAYSIFIK